MDDGFPHARALVFGSSGTVSFVTSGGDTVSGFAVSAGQELRLGIVRVLATGTSATPFLPWLNSKVTRKVDRKVKLLSLLSIYPLLKETPMYAVISHRTAAAVTIDGQTFEHQRWTLVDALTEAWKPLPSPRSAKSSRSCGGA